MLDRAKKEGRLKEDQEQIDENLPMTSLKPGHDEKAARFLARQVKGTPVKGKAQSAPQKEGGMKKKVKEEVEQVDERQMTEPEMKKREEIVKSMKKGMTGFKQRYGERAKSVLYATATKQAMKEESESEHYNAGHEYAANHAQDSGFKVTARARKKEMLADNPHKKGTPEHADWHRGALAGHQTALDNM